MLPGNIFFLLIISSARTTCCWGFNWTSLDYNSCQMSFQLEFSPDGLNTLVITRALQDRLHAPKTSSREPN